MASSTYNFLVSACNKSMERISEKTIQDALESDKTIKYAYGKEINLGETGAGFIMGNEEHTCRETLLNYAYKVVSRIMWGHQTAYKMCTFLYLKEKEIPLSKTRTDKIMALAHRINYPEILKIDLITYQSNHAIAVTIPCQTIKNMYLALLLLWIFRREEILDWLLAHIGEFSGYYSLLRFLSRQFLLHPEWGDTANNPILMSIFCYTFGNYNTSDINHNGPVNLAANISTLRMSQYFENLYCPMLKEFKGVLPEKSRLTDHTNSSLTHLLIFEKAFYKKPRKKTVKPVATQESEV